MSLPCLCFFPCLQYTDYVRYVEPCFRGTLVQADLDNREVRPLSASWKPKEPRRHLSSHHTDANTEEKPECHYQISLLAYFLKWHQKPQQVKLELESLCACESFSVKAEGTVFFKTTSNIRSKLVTKVIND